MLGMVGLASGLLVSDPALAQPERDQAWDTVSTVTLATSAGLQLVMPRVAYFETETTVGFKPRWR